DEERRDRVPASQMAGIMGEQDLVDKLGLSAEEAKDVVAAVQRNPQFIDLVDAKTANTVMTLAIAKTVAERMGAQVDEKAQEQGVKDRAA
ncbi:MAG: hypothetical protein KKD39_04825, partial [Candidatus Altiarchaeota archaeon]|nr:hypothetical protein [Candidatus Altiarchaeota archaeon]